MITYGLLTISELLNSPNYHEIYTAYKDECAVDGLPSPDEKLAAYHALEKTDMFWAYGAFDRDNVVGFIATITPIIPHYGVAITVAESLFVLPAYRHTGAGLKLIAAAENHAKHKGSAGISLSAPAGGKLSQVMKNSTYKLTNEIYFKALP